MLTFSRLISAAYLVLAVGVVGLTALFGPLPLNFAPFPLLPGPEREPVVVSLAYGTEKEAWLQEAASRFQQTHPTVRGHPITLDLEGIGSREGVKHIVDGEMQPVVFSPASSIQIELLRYEWETRHQSDIFLRGDDAPLPLVYTPLVLVAWEDRARTLWPNGPQNIWHRLHDVLAEDGGWAAMGGDPQWGFAKFGHTSPEKSNSGIQTLVLLAYAYHGKTRSLTVDDVLDQGFRQWLEDIERAVMDFGESTGTFMNTMVNFGPGAYDFVAVYENLPIETFEAAENRWNQRLRVYYPPATILSDHPYAILNADWVTEDQHDAAAAFRDFLRTQEMQTLALRYGFRPASPTVSVSSTLPDNPFTTYESYGLRTDTVPPQVEIPPAEVLNELMNLWRRGGYDR
jgi:hypothetical protein